MDDKQKKIMWGLFGVLAATVFVAVFMLAKDWDDDEDDDDEQRED